MKNQDTNTRSIMITVLLLVITYNYYITEPGGIISFEGLIGVAIVIIILMYIYFAVIKSIAYFTISNKIYPLVLFRILIPFSVITLVFWIIYGLMYVKPFGLNKDFFAIVKYFLSHHALFTAICTTINGLVLSFPFQLSFSFPEENVHDKLLFKQNFRFLYVVTGVFVLSIPIFYLAERIKQPPLAHKYTQYKSLKDMVSSANYDIKLLLTARKHLKVSEPYHISNRKELIIYTTHRNDELFTPLDIVYRINKNGKVTDSIHETEITNEKFNTLLFQDGLLTDPSHRKFVTWVFDLNKTTQNKLVRKDEWKSDKLNLSNENVKKVSFYKTAVFECSNLKSVQYNGTNYYDIIANKDTLRIKIDSAFYNTEANSFEEKKLDYYKSEQLNLSLLRLNEHTYYIILPKR